MSAQSSRILTPADSGGPSSPPPSLPEGWLAQWEGVSRKWYYVQRATGKSQWEIPTEPFVPTPSSTPQSVASPGPYHPPRVGSMPAQDTTEATRELLNLRGANLRQSGGSFLTTPFDSSQTTPQSGQDYQQIPSAGTQSTPVGGVSSQQQQQQQQSRSPSQGILGQVASDLAHRVASQNGSENTSNQQMPEQSQVRYSPAGQASPSSNLNSQHMSGSAQFHQGDQMDQGNVQMQDVSPNTAASYQTQQDSSSTYHTDVEMRMHQPYTTHQAGPAANMDSQYHSQPASGQPAPTNSYDGQVQHSNEQLLIQQAQSSHYASRPVQNPQPEENLITIIHPDPNAPPLFPTPYRGGPRQSHGSRLSMTTTPPRNYPSHPAPHYNPHPSMGQPQYNPHYSGGHPGVPPNSHSPPVGMPRSQQPPYPPEGMYHQSMGPPSQSHNMYGAHQGQPNYAYDVRVNPPYSQMPPQNMHDDRGMQRQTSQVSGQPWHGHPGSAPSPPDMHGGQRYPPAHSQQHYGGGYGR
ncbi:hypothetical protein, variant [Blastomyces dermatitidis ER-3]|uniref:WW domain-containing protein n=1 Tax=Ajellomyces dermatitidis (strain ER-3 / ATCC MYA-2586) TaxID=559297 RepID=A0ABX2VWT5_AJEDR|nr:uncharacterized protein BDCG_05642 [Blastomyces dermatitidis ER-3]XP_045281340.1 hypothetical protein, variant [Blastomyces dermatitidis ER-3]OAT01612.1 hypothetical protein BDCG_05642 [Blastomyces dermatitidis ER-3]OAT01613.1 hypothetical protein, variant [Blastomyces dermatitidis ER-3]